MKYELPDHLKAVQEVNNGVPAAVLVSFQDNRLPAWSHSRPNIKDILIEDMTDIYTADFGISDQLYVTLSIRSSVLFREILMSFRGTNPWAQTSRVLPIAETKVSSEYAGTSAYAESYDLIREAADRYANGVPQDQARLSVPVTASTSYFFGANWRTWVIICKVLEGLNTDLADRYAQMIWSELCKVVNESYRQYGAIAPIQLYRLDSYKFDTKGLAIQGLRVTEDELAQDPSSMTHMGTTVAKFRTNIGMAAQFARHGHNQFRSNIWDYFTSPIEEHVEYNLLSPLTVITSMPSTSYKTMLSHRAEWLADWGLWSDFVESGTKHMTDEEFMALLDDPQNYLGDNLARIDLTDPNLPDPRIIQCKDMLTSRIEREGLNYISRRWLSLIQNHDYVIENEQNPLRLAYFENLLK